MEIELWYLVLAKYGEFVGLVSGPFIDEQSARRDSVNHPQPDGDYYLTTMKTKHQLFKSYE